MDQQILVSNMEKTLNCFIHHGICQNPVSLGCGHNFCKDCISNIIKNVQGLGKIIACPQCQEITKCPNGKDSLNINFNMQQMINLVQQMNNVNINSPQDAIVNLILSTFMNKNEKIEIKSIEEIKIPLLESKFQANMKAIKGHKEVLQKLHGTYEKFVKGINTKGLKIPDSFMRTMDDQEGTLTFGKAVYLSSYSSKVVNYGDGVIIVCDVVLGRVKVFAESKFNIDLNYAKENNFDTIFYEQTQTQNPDICKGSLTDEYAIFNSFQVLPKYLVRYQVMNTCGQNFNLKYSGNHTMQNTDIQIVIKAQQGTLEQSRVANQILGDLCRDYTSYAIKEILKYYNQFIQGILGCLESQNEQVILHALRVLWNSSYKNKQIQGMIYQSLGNAIFLKTLSCNHESVLERCVGVIQNLSELEKTNAKQFTEGGILDKLLKIFQANLKSSNQEFLIYLLGSIGNIIRYSRLQVNDRRIGLFQSFVEPFIDHDNQKISDESLRILSNQIGFDDEWVEQGYKASEGLNKL